MKIRGTAHHVGEKYLQLARDAQSSGDPVMAESYLQHAEHYFRLIAAAQQAQQQAAYGYQRNAGDQSDSDDDDGDDDFSSLPDRFASPAERITTPPAPAPQPYVERPVYNGGDRQPYEPRADRYERMGQDRPAQERSYQDRQSQPDRQDERPPRYDSRQDRYEGRQDRNGRGERPAAYADRAQGDRPQSDRPQGDRPQGDRSYGDRTAPERGNQPERAERNGQDRNGQGRDYDNRSQRNGSRGQRDFRGETNTPREPRESQQPRDARQPDAEPIVNALPAFITTPVRIQPDPVAETPVVTSAQETAPSGPDIAAEDTFALRPRRRRRTKAEFSGAESEAIQNTPAPDPVGD